MPALLCRVAAVVALASLAASACAQYPPSGRGDRGPPQGSRTSRGDVPSSAVSSPMIQVQLDQLEDDLRLSKEQQPAWNRYAERVTPLMEGLRRAREPASQPTGSATEQLDDLVTVARSRVTTLEAIADAGKALYGALTPEQRKIADARLARLVAPSLGLPLFAPGTASGRP